MLYYEDFGTPYSGLLPVGYGRLVRRRLSVPRYFRVGARRVAQVVCRRLHDGEAQQRERRRARHRRDDPASQPRIHLVPRHWINPIKSTGNLVVPDQPWLDGINAGNGFIRQVVAMPLGGLSLRRGASL